MVSAAACLEHRQHDAARRATRAEQQNPRAFEPHAEVLLDVAHDADAVGVVAANAVDVERERVHRARRRGARRERIGERVGVELERHGHVHAASARFDERAHVVLERADRAEDAAVFDRLARLLGKRA